MSLPFLGAKERTLTVNFDVASSEQSVSAHVKLQVLLPVALPDEEAHACITEKLLYAVREHMRVLLTPSDEDLHHLSETARSIEANLGEECARQYMEHTLAAYGSGRFALCTDEKEGALRWSIRRCTKPCVPT